MSDPTCPVHHRPLICPACAGARGGAKTSPAKAEAAAKNAKKANAARWPKRAKKRPRKAQEHTE